MIAKKIFKQTKFKDRFYSGISWRNMYEVDDPIYFRIALITHIKNYHKIFKYISSDKCIFNKPRKRKLFKKKPIFILNLNVKQKKISQNIKYNTKPARVLCKIGP